VREPKGPALFNELLSQELPATDGSVSMGDEEEETEEVPGIPMPELDHHRRIGWPCVGLMIRRLFSQSYSGLHSVHFAKRTESRRQKAYG